MAHINLLPWREELRKQKKKDFATAAVVAAGLMLAVVGYVHIYIDGLIDSQTGRNEYLKKEIQEVELKINEIKDLEKKKSQLISRMRIVEQLQSDRPQIVRRFDELVRIIPDGLYLNVLEQVEDVLTISGLAQSNARVSSFMRKLDASDFYNSPKLEFIKTQKQGSGEQRSFQLSVKVSRPD